MPTHPPEDRKNTVCSQSIYRSAAFERRVSDNRLGAWIGRIRQATKAAMISRVARTEILEQEAVTPRLGLEYFDLVGDFPTSRRKPLQRLSACGTCMVQTGRALKHEACRTFDVGMVRYAREQKGRSKIQNTIYEYYRRNPATDIWRFDGPPASPPPRRATCLTPGRASARTAAPYNVIDTSGRGHKGAALEGTSVPEQDS